MKRFLAALLIVALMFSMTGCQWLKIIAILFPGTSQPPATTVTTSTTKPVDPPTPPEPKDSDLVRVIDYIPSAKQSLAYATTQNFTGSRIYDFTDAYLRYGTIKKLMLVSDELEKQGFGLLIWDGFRPVSAQKMLWDICPDANFVSHPVTGKRAHCRGNTLDVTLYSLSTGKPVTMPSSFDDFSAAADRDYSDCSAEAAANARLLEQTMKRCGFAPYQAEWWHFSDTKDYPVEETFYPAAYALWTANVNEYLNLRSTPGGRILARIPKGGAVELHSWDGQYAIVRYNGQLGYVMSNYIQPADNYLSECLDTVAVTNMYSYDQLLADVNTLQSRYPNQLTVDSIGSSELGRNIPVLRVGNPNAEYHVLLHGAIHAREHMTAWLLMAITDYWLDNNLSDYGNVCFHIVPMVNPDGVIISQTGVLTEEQNQIYLSDRRNNLTSDGKSRYTSRWKANGKGVDLNGNFDAGWGLSNHPNNPSCQSYPGTAPFCAAEAAALREYTLKHNFDCTISYHATGSLIYYEYGKKQPVNNLSKSLGAAVKEISGYPLIDSKGINGGGYKDWAIDVMEIPSLTVEIGCAEAPLAQREIYSIFLRNYRILPAIARWLQIQ